MTIDKFLEEFLSEFKKIRIALENLKEKQECRNCQGTGKVGMNRDRYCDACDGRGY